MLNCPSKVEYLLFECLQDLTGGYAIFTLAVNSYMVDVSSEAARTARICFVSAAGALGFMVGNPLGAAIRAALGYTAVFGINLGTWKTTPLDSFPPRRMTTMARLIPNQPQRRDSV